MFPSLPPQDPSREHGITDSVPVALHPADAPNTLRHPVPTPRPDARASAPAAPAPSDADDAPAPPAPPAPSPAGRSTGVDTPNVGGGGALGGATPSTTGPSVGASAAAHSFPPNATPLPSRIADLVQDYIPTLQVLRDRDHGIKFLKPSKKGKNKDLYHRYSAATTTRQYFDLGGSAADWRYDLKHKYVTFTDPDLRRRAGELLSLRTLSEDALLSVFSAGTSSASVTPVSGGEGEPSLSDRAAQALNYICYFQPDRVLSKLNKWLVDPGVHDTLAANRIAQFESLFHMSPEEMEEHSAHEQASKNLFGNTMNLDDEIEELLMFYCLHDDDCDDIDPHLYEMHVNDDDGVPLATPKMLRVDAQQLVCLCRTQASSGIHQSRIKGALRTSTTRHICYLSQR